MDPVTPELLKIEEAARVLRIGRSKAYAMASAGTLPGVVHIGGSVRVSASALKAWIAREAAAGVSQVGRRRAP